MPDAVPLSLTHSTENACSELILGERNWNGAHLHHGTKSRTDQGSTDEILCNIQSPFSVCCLFFPKRWIVDFREITHDHIEDQESGGDNVGAHGKRVLKSNHRAHRQTESLVMSVERWGLVFRFFLFAERKAQGAQELPVVLADQGSLGTVGFPQFENPHGEIDGQDRLD